MPTYADKLGFIVIYPATTHNSGCWDVRSTQSVTHNGGGDSLGIISMVKYALDKYSADPAKVFSAGSSSGGMMTNVLLATYPDVFAAGASFSGSPDGCWDGPTPSALGGASCPAKGQKYSTKDWGDLVRKAYPGFNGTRPAMQVWHGTADTVVAYANLADQLAQWSDVLGVSWMKNVTNSPESGYTEMVYGDGTKLVGYSAVGVGHMVPFHDEEVLKFFHLL
jgi:acetylxylan esterase